MRRLTQLSNRMSPSTHSTLRHPNNIRWRGVTMVICLHITARVRSFSPNTKNGNGKLIGRLSQFTDDLCTSAGLCGQDLVTGERKGDVMEHRPVADFYAPR